MNQKHIGTFLKKYYRLIAAFCVVVSIATAVMAQTPSGPPMGGGPYLSSTLVELVKLDPTIKLDIRYATSNNFFGKAVYPEPRAFLQRPAAEALLSVHRWLKEQATAWWFMMPTDPGQSPNCFGISRRQKSECS